jgi:hypothetical protein
MRRCLAAAVLVGAVFVGLPADGEGSNGKEIEVGRATAVTPAQLRSQARAVGHPIYWAGERRGYVYEFTRTPSRNTYVRYLPRGVKIGTKALYLTVATYAVPGAYAALIKSGRSGTRIELAHGGIAVVDRSSPTSIHIAYRGSDLQIEVFDPSAKQGRELVASGAIRPAGA